MTPNACPRCQSRNSLYTEYWPDGAREMLFCLMCGYAGPTRAAPKGRAAAQALTRDEAIERGRARRLR